ncbi:hypothetical protein BC567DRAFT_216326 [Phyllosticta citribraziliensis]
MRFTDFKSLQARTVLPVQTSFRLPPALRQSVQHQLVFRHDTLPAFPTRARATVRLRAQPSYGCASQSRCRNPPVARKNDLPRPPYTTTRFACSAAPIIARRHLSTSPHSFDQDGNEVACAAAFAT